MDGWTARDGGSEGGKELREGAEGGSRGREGLSGGGSVNSSTLIAALVFDLNSRLYYFLCNGSKNRPAQRQRNISVIASPTAAAAGMPPCLPRWPPCLSLPPCLPLSVLSSSHFLTSLACPPGPPPHPAHSLSLSLSLCRAISFSSPRR